MKHTGKSRFCKLITIASCCVMFAPTAFAGFDVYSKDWPNDPSVVGEYLEEKAVIPSGTSGIISSEEACVQDMSLVPPKSINEKNRLYFKFGVNFLTSKADKIENESNGVFAGFNLNKQSATDDYLSWELGLGTSLQFARFELEYVHTKTLLYGAVPAFEGRLENISSEVKNDSLMLNAFWDFEMFTYFKPYVGVLGGFSWNRTRTVISGGTLGDGIADNRSNYSIIVWGLTMGAQMPFWERWRMYMQYRYTDQNNILWSSNAGGLKLKGNYLLTGFSLGVIYIF